jgi:hypothetical protein
MMGYCYQAFSSSETRHPEQEALLLIESELLIEMIATSKILDTSHT